MLFAFFILSFFVFLFYFGWNKTKCILLSIDDIMDHIFVIVVVKIYSRKRWEKKDTEIEYERKKGRKYTRITLMKRNRTATEQSNCIISRQCWWGPNLLLCIYLSDKSSSHFVLSAALYSVHVSGEYSFLKELTKKTNKKISTKKKFPRKKNHKNSHLCSMHCAIVESMCAKDENKCTAMSLKELLLKAKQQNRTKNMRPCITWPEVVHSIVQNKTVLRCAWYFH